MISLGQSVKLEKGRLQVGIFNLMRTHLLRSQLGKNMNLNSYKITFLRGPKGT